jgi:hypothetical protein
LGKLLQAKELQEGVCEIIVDKGLTTLEGEDEEVEEIKEAEDRGISTFMDFACAGARGRGGSASGQKIAVRGGAAAQLTDPKSTRTAWALSSK